MIQYGNQPEMPDEFGSSAEWATAFSDALPFASPAPGNRAGKSEAREV